MKIKHRLIRLCLLTAGLLAVSPAATAQTYTVLKSFTNILDGAYVYSTLRLDGRTLYGTTDQGGSAGFAGYGTVFKINTDGTDYKLLKDFTNNADGAYPDGALTLGGNVLYGTTRIGGDSDGGTVFKVNTDGTGFARIMSFDANSLVAANQPYAGLVLFNNVLYGTTARGGRGSDGTVFKVNTDGTGYTVLHDFFGSGYGDGAVPFAGLTLSGNVLYGTTYAEGDGGQNGTVFKINTDGNGYTILYNFAGNPDGANPSGGLILSGNVLYGTTTAGGNAQDGGTLFKINTDGTGYAVIKRFPGDREGSPQAELSLMGNTLYGTTSDCFGSVFQIHTDGTGYTPLKNYIYEPNDGLDPITGVTLAGNTIYGTTYEGGDFGGPFIGYGTIFSMSLVPTLTIVVAGNQAILSWPIWAPNFSLQSTTNLAAPAWTAVTDAPVVIGANNVVTNAISGIQQFYRLNQ